MNTPNRSADPALDPGRFILAARAAAPIPTAPAEGKDLGDAPEPLSPQEHAENLETLRGALRPEPFSFGPTQSEAAAAGSELPPPGFLSPEETRFREDLADHIAAVRQHLRTFSDDLDRRGRYHDLSKLSPEEMPGFIHSGFLRSGAEFGTPTYEAAKQDLGAALAHHYAHNRHHPEHHAGGVDDMNLLDLLEMLSDWKAAAAARPTSKTWPETVDLLAEKYKISPQLSQIIRNTADWLDNPKGD